MQDDPKPTSPPTPAPPPARPPDRDPGEFIRTVKIPPETKIPRGSGGG